MMETGDLGWEGLYPPSNTSAQRYIFFNPIVIALVLQNYLAPHRLYLLILAGKLTFFVWLIRPRRP